MTDFSILVTAGPQRPGALTALRTARAIHVSHHSLYRLFLYGDAVLLAEQTPPTGPTNETSRAWQDWIAEARVPAAVCVGAAHRRGVTSDTLATGFELVGLGDWIDALKHGQRVVHFG